MKNNSYRELIIYTTFGYRATEASSSIFRSGQAPQGWQRRTRISQWVRHLGRHHLRINKYMKFPAVVTFDKGIQRTNNNYNCTFRIVAASHLVKTQTQTWKPETALEKSRLIFAQKVKNAKFLLKSQDSVQESWKCKILLQSQKSAEKVPSTIEKCLFLGTNIQNTCGGIKIPKYRARTPVTTYTRNALSQKSREAVKAHGWE